MSYRMGYLFIVASFILFIVMFLTPFEKLKQFYRNIINFLLVPVAVISIIYVVLSGVVSYVINFSWDGFRHYWHDFLNDMAAFIFSEQFIVFFAVVLVTVARVFCAGRKKNKG